MPLAIGANADLTAEKGLISAGQIEHPAFACATGRRPPLRAAHRACQVPILALLTGMVRSAHTASNPLPRCAPTVLHMFHRDSNATLASSFALSVLTVLVGMSAGAAESLGPGDMIRVTVFQSPDLTTEARISSQGTLVFPLIGEVPVADRSPIQAGALIAERLRKGRFILDPQVSVNLVEVRSRQVSVLGHVASPGKYPLGSQNLSLSDVLALAGGITQSGDDTVIVMTQRNGQDEKLEINVPQMYRSGDLSSNIQLDSGDTVFVPSAPVFYVYGAVQRAGAYRLEPETSVLRAITLGGGLSPRGTERGLKIHRRMADGSVDTFDVELSDPVKPDDVIDVSESVF